MFESRISAGATEKLPCSENLSISSWSHVEGHAKECVNDIVSWQTGRLNSSTKYQLHALATIISKKNELISVRKLSKVCSQIVFFF